MDGDAMVLLHGFIKKERKTPKAELDLAKQRLKRIRSAT
jgi:phage-related protein